jgi:hypothetical protein
LIDPGGLDLGAINVPDLLRTAMSGQSDVLCLLESRDPASEVIDIGDLPPEADNTVEVLGLASVPNETSLQALITSLRTTALPLTAEHLYQNLQQSKNLVLQHGSPFFMRLNQEKSIRLDAVSRLVSTMADESRMLISIKLNELPNRNSSQEWLRWLGSAPETATEIRIEDWDDKQFLFSPD